MHRLIILSILFFSICNTLTAQQEAVTRDGRVVNLFDNGTWKYKENADSKPLPSQESISAISADTPITIKDIELERETFLEGPSAKLKRYFKVKNIVRCDLSLTGNKGKALLKIEWKVQTPEAFSYFGYIKKGAPLTLKLRGGKSVDIIFSEEVSPKEYTKYGFSTYKAQAELTTAQINMLRSSIVESATMKWSRRSEQYQLKNPAYFVIQLPELLK